MTTDENVLNSGFRQSVLWQTGGVEDSRVAEPAINIRTYFGGIISLRQGNAEILLNTGSVKELTKILKSFSDTPVIEL